MNRRAWILALALAAAPTLMTAVSPRGPNPGTPESLMAVGKEANTLAQERASVERAMVTFTNRLATDKAFATTLLSAIQKKDTTGIASLVRQAGMPGRIEIGRIDDGFHLEINMTISTIAFHSCFSDDHSCEGHNVVLG